MKAANHDFYEFWRRGDARKWKSHERRVEWEKIKLPLSGQWPGFSSVIQRTGKRAMYRVQKSKQSSKSQARMMAGLKEVERVKKWFGAGFKFKKMLGFGGIGMATLFTKVDADGTELDFVAKVDLDPSNNHIKEEIMNHRVS